MICFDEFGPVEVRPQRGRTWRPRSKPSRVRATYRRIHGVRHYLSAYDVHADKLWMRSYKRKRRTEVLSFLKYIRAKFPDDIRIHLILDNWSPHKCKNVVRWAKKANVRLVYTPTDASWLNRIEAIFSGIKYFVFGDTDFQNHTEIATEIRRYVRWRNSRPDHPKLRKLENSN